MAFCLKRCFSRFPQLSLSVRSFAVKAPTAGEWIVSPCPDVDFILKNREKLVQSLIKRIHVYKELEAEEILDVVASSYEEFLDARKRLEVAQREFSCTSKSKTSQIDYYAITNNLSEAKSHYNESILDLTRNCLNLPNILIDYHKAICHFDSKLKDCSDNENVSSKIVSGNIENGGLEYSTGLAAERELEIIEQTAKYLTSASWIEVTCPSFIRKDVLKILDYPTDEIPEIQSKQEMHRQTGISSSPVLDRKTKPEDNYIYLLTGLHELSLMLLFMREIMPSNKLPIKLFSIGNRYQDSTLGLPPQTRVASGLVIAESEKSAKMHFSALLFTVKDILRRSGFIKLEVKATPSHELHNHEASSATFFSSKKPIAKVSLSSTYISSRIQAFQEVNSAEFKPVHMVSCDFIDIGSAVRLPFSQSTDCSSRRIWDTFPDWWKKMQ